MSHSAATVQQWFCLFTQLTAQTLYTDEPRFATGEVRTRGFDTSALRVKSLALTKQTGLLSPLPSMLQRLYLFFVGFKYWGITIAKSFLLLIYLSIILTSLLGDTANDDVDISMFRCCFKKQLCNVDISLKIFSCVSFPCVVSQYSLQTDTGREKAKLYLRWEETGVIFETDMGS